MSVSPKSARAALREALLDAAEAVVARDGFGAVRARGLTEAVGCALGALYTAFPDMDALMLAVKLRVLDRLDARVAASLDGGTPGDDRLPRAMARAYLDFAWDERRQWELLFQHHLAGSGDLPGWYRDRLGDVFALIAGPLAAALPGLSEPEALRLAHTLFAAVHGIVALGVEGKLGPASRAETAARVDAVVRAALAGFGADPGLVEAVGSPADDDGAGRRPAASVR